MRAHAHATTWRDAEVAPTVGKPGAISLAALEPVASPPLFRGDEAFEDIEPVGHHADEHRKVVRDYAIRKELAVTDLKQRARGRTNTRDGGAHDDGKISVDISTVVGGYVLVWKARKTPGPDPSSGDPTGWVRIAKLPKAARRDIAAFQARRARAARGGPGTKANRTGERFTIAPVRPETITEKFVPRADSPTAKLEAFRIKGGSVDDSGDPTSTPCGNYTLNPARYGQNIVGVWNPPGSTGANGKANAGSGGIRAFIPIGKDIERCDLAPIVIENYDKAVGNGTSTWVYVTCMLAGERIYCWVLRSWMFTTNGFVDRSGQNF